LRWFCRDCRVISLAILIAQHMPESFTGVFARRINSLSELEVVEVTRPMPLRGGVAYIGRGDADFLVGMRAGVLTAIRFPRHPAQLASKCRTAWLRRTGARHPGASSGVMLTGMGDDGAAAMAELRSRGGRTIAESEDTAVVWECLANS